MASTLSQGPARVREAVGAHGQPAERGEVGDQPGHRAGVVGVLDVPAAQGRPGHQRQGAAVAADGLGEPGLRDLGPHELDHVRIGWRRRLGRGDVERGSRGGLGEQRGHRGELEVVAVPRGAQVQEVDAAARRDGHEQALGRRGEDAPGGVAVGGEGDGRARVVGETVGPHQEQLAGGGASSAPRRSTQNPASSSCSAVAESATAYSSGTAAPAATCSGTTGKARSRARQSGTSGTRMRRKRSGRPGPSSIRGASRGCGLTAKPAAWANARSCACSPTNSSRRGPSGTRAAADSKISAESLRP